MTPDRPEAESNGELIGRCYTKARRTPLVVGSVPGGAGQSLRLAGGPYTLTQLAAIVVTVVLLILTRPVWGGHGLLDVVALLGAPFGVASGLKHVHIDGRNPVAALASVAVMMADPASGRIHGHPYKPARFSRADACVTLTERPSASDAARLAPTRPSPAEASSHVDRPTRAAPPARPAAPSTPPAAHAPVASGVQALLARRAAPPARTDLED